MYKPVSLPALPRAVCPFRVYTLYYDHGDERVKTVPCINKPLNHGWCLEHEYVINFLIAGYVLNWPAIKVSESRQIDEGIQAWEELAIRLHNSIVLMRNNKPIGTNIYEIYVAAIWEKIKEDPEAERRYREYRQTFRNAA